MISGLLSPDMVSKASSLVGETPEATRKGFDGAIPTVLNGLLNHTSGNNGARVLGGMLGTPGVGAGMLDNLGSVFSGGSETESITRTGSRLLSSMFGSGLGSVTDSLSSSAGVRRSSAGSLLAMAVPLVLSFLNRHKASRGLSDSGLLDQLRGQRSQIAEMLPRGVSDVRPAERTVEVVQERRTPGWRRWLPLLIAVAIAIPLLSWLAGRGRRAAAPQNAVERVTENFNLPGGGRIAALRGSVPAQLATYFASGSTEVPRTFSLGDFTFESGTSNFASGAGQTVDNIATILRAYPTARVRIEGHTDNTGNDADNRALSLSHANAVRDRLVAAGVSADRLETAGFGPDRPIASNDTAEGRARNQRTDIVVTQR
jgi:OOP family OmpA-OmpF porin